MYVHGVLLLRVHNSCVQHVVIINCYEFAVRVRGSAGVKALRYKPEGRGFDSRWSN
jgi:hypothetical protein